MFLFTVRKVIACTSAVLGERLKIHYVLVLGDGFLAWSQVCDGWLVERLLWYSFRFSGSLKAAVNLSSATERISRSSQAWALIQYIYFRGHTQSFRMCFAKPKIVFKWLRLVCLMLCIIKNRLIFFSSVAATETKQGHFNEHNQERKLKYYKML